MQAGYHQANMMEKSDTSEFMNTFQNFAHTVTTDKNTTAHLVEANAKLVESNKILTNQLAEAIQKLDLRSQVSNNNKKLNDFSTKRTQKKWILWDTVGRTDIKYVMVIIALHVQISEKVIKMR